MFVYAREKVTLLVVYTVFQIRSTDHAKQNKSCRKLN